MDYLIFICALASIILSLKYNDIDLMKIFGDHEKIVSILFGISGILLLVMDRTEKLLPNVI